MVPGMWWRVGREARGENRAWEKEGGLQVAQDVGHHGQEWSDKAPREGTGLLLTGSPVTAAVLSASYVPGTILNALQVLGVFPLHVSLKAAQGSGINIGKGGSGEFRLKVTQLARE